MMFSMLRPDTATFRRVDDLLDTVDIGGEGGNNDPLLAPGKEPVKGPAHDGLAHGVPRALHVGGIGKQGQHALLAQLPEAPQVDDVPVNGGGVDLEVPGVNDDAHAGMDGKGNRVGDGVVDVDEFHIKFPHLNHFPGLHGDQLGLFEQAVFLQLQLDEPGGQTGAVYRHIHLLENVGDGPDVVLMSVGDEQAPDAPLVFHQIGYVGNYQIDAVHISVRESHAAVHYDDFSAVFVYGHVFADLVEAAKRDDLHFFCQNKCLLFVRLMEKCW